MHVGLGLNLGVGLGVGRAGPAYAYNYVVFDGGDRLQNSTNLGLSAASDYTLAVAFRIDSLASNNLLLGMTTGIGGLFMAQVSSTGAIQLSSPTDASTHGFLSAASATGAVVAGTDYVLHVAVRASSQTLSVWLNNSPLSMSGTFWFGTANLTQPTAWSIGSAVGGGSNLVGRMGLMWLGWGQYITNPAAFFPAKALGNQMQNPGAQPSIGFGDTQTATNWNAGTNLGNGTGSWVVTPAAGIG